MADVIELDGIGAGAARDAVKCEIAAWPGVSLHAGPMPGSTEFRFRHRILGHLHAASGGIATADMIFSPEMGEALITSGRALPHPMIPGMGWVSAQLRGQADVAKVTGLFRQNYERVCALLRAV